MRILRNILSVVGVIALGSVTMTVLHNLQMTIWPEEAMPPQSASREEFQAWMAGLSMATMLAATVVHWLGTAVGAAAGVLIAAPSKEDGPRAMWPAWTAGVGFGILGIANAYMLGTPLWLTVVDVLGYVPSAYLVGRALSR